MGGCLDKARFQKLSINGVDKNVEYVCIIVNLTAQDATLSSAVR